MMLLLIFLAITGATAVPGDHPPIWCAFSPHDCVSLIACWHVPAECTFLGYDNSDFAIYGKSFLNTTNAVHVLDIGLHYAPDCSDLLFQGLFGESCGVHNNATIHDTCHNQFQPLSVSWECYPPESIYAPAVAQTPRICLYEGLDCNSTSVGCQELTPDCEFAFTVEDMDVYSSSRVVGPVPGDSRDVLSVAYFADDACTDYITGFSQKPCGRPDVTPPATGDNCEIVDLVPGEAYAIQWDCYAESDAASVHDVIDGFAIVHFSLVLSLMLVVVDFIVFAEFL